MIKSYIMNSSMVTNGRHSDVREGDPDFNESHAVSNYITCILVGI